MSNLPGKFPGTKARLIPRIEPHYPQHNIYTVLFGGLMSEILCRKGRSLMESACDNNFDATNFAIHCRDYLPELIKKIQHVQYSKHFFDEAKYVLDSDYGTKLDRAAAFCIIANLSRGNSAPTHNPSFSFNFKSNANTNRWRVIEETLLTVSRRLRAVQITHATWDWLLSAQDTNETLLSVDPPFLETLSGNKFYGRPMTTVDEHAYLLERLLAAKSKWILYGYPSKLYASVLKDIFYWDFPTSTHISNQFSAERKLTRVWYRF